jgi:hypothetical protein
MLKTYHNILASDWDYHRRLRIHSFLRSCTNEERKEVLNDLGSRVEERKRTQLAKPTPYGFDHSHWFREGKKVHEEV